MKDEMISPKGHIKIQTYKETEHGSELLDVFEDNNLVMDGARRAMQRLQQGDITNGLHINSIRLGTDGVISGGIHDPKPPGNGPNQYNPTMDGLFSEANGYVFKAVFGNDANITVPSASVEEVMLDSDLEVQGYVSSGCLVTRSVSDRVVTFEFEIVRTQANPAQGFGLAKMEYNEAQLYCGDTIFSMKTFPSKFKDIDTKLIITWSIIF